jgi:hypothetical protein
MKKWLLYNLTVGFALYWTGNIILWYPWSVNVNFGIALMLTIMPLFWGLGIYLCLIRFRGENIVVACALTALTMLISSVILDYIFFGLIRGAMNDLYKPTTFYGYGFLILAPFIELLLIKKILLRKRRNILVKDFVSIGMVGCTSFIIQILIVISI